MRRLLIAVAVPVAFVALLPAHAQTVKIIGIRVAAPFCGDGRIDPGEDCDGTNIGSHLCSEFSCSTGTPTCNGSCVIIATGCSTCTTGDLLDEAFGPGTQTDGTTAGFDDASWTKSGDVVSGDKPLPNPNATSSDGCPTTTGWSGDCLKIAVNPNLVAFHNVKETNAFTASAAGVWVRARLKETFTFTTPTANHAIEVMAIGTAASFQAAGSAYLEIQSGAGPSYVLRMIAVGGGVVGSTYAITSGESLCIEMMLNSSTTTGQWWLNGADMGSVTDPTTMNVTPTNLWLGVAAATSSGDTITQWWDSIEVSSTGRLACN